jgi:hypothetical protein
MFKVIYSPDGGRNWFHASDDTKAVPGVRPTASYALITSPYSMSFDSEGANIVRVECFRKGIQTHYSYHQIRVLALTSIASE